MVFSVNLRDSSFESDITHGKHVRLSKDHDAEYGKVAIVKDLGEN
jgi:hypothetical protein